MRVLLYTTEYPPYSGGVGTFAEAAAMGLAVCGASVTVVAPAYSDKSDPLGQAGDHRVRRVAKNAQSPVAERLVLLREFLFRPPDVLLLANGKATRRASRLGRLPMATVVYLHGSEVESHFDPSRRCSRGREQVQLEDLFERAMCLLTVSGSTAELVAKHRPRFRAKTHVAYLGLHPDRLQFLTGDNSGTVSSPPSATVLCVARLAPDKGQDVLLLAMREVLERVPQAVLRVAGDGPMRAALEVLRNELSLGDHVHFLGDLGPKVLATEYQKCDVFAMVSRRESFGLVYLEANVFGKPVIAGRTGGVPEVVLDGVTGVLVNPTDTSAVARTIVRLLQDPMAAAAMGQAGHARVLREFTHVQMAQRILRHLSPAASLSRSMPTRLWTIKRLTRLASGAGCRRLAPKSIRGRSLEHVRIGGEASP